MNEFVVAEINPDVGETTLQGVVEHQVTGLHVLVVDLFADVADFFRRARQDHAPGFLEDVAHHAAAIQTVLGRIAAEAILNAEHAHGTHRQFRGTIGEVVEA